MKKLAVSGTMIAATLLFNAAAHADVCYRLDAYRDIIRLSFVKSPGKGDKRHMLAFGNWIAPEYSSYPVTGAYEADTGTTGRVLSLVGPHFPGSQYATCAFRGKPGGNWELKCAGDVFFRNTGSNFRKVSCRGLPSRTGANGVEDSNLALPATRE